MNVEKVTAIVATVTAALMLASAVQGENWIAAFFASSSAWFAWVAAIRGDKE